PSTRYTSPRSAPWRNRVNTTAWPRGDTVPVVPEAVVTTPKVVAAIREVITATRFIPTPPNASVILRSVGITLRREESSAIGRMCVASTEGTLYGRTMVGLRTHPIPVPCSGRNSRCGSGASQSPRRLGHVHPPHLLEKFSHRCLTWMAALRAFH